MNLETSNPDLISDVMAFNWDVTPSAVGNKTLKALSGAIKKLAQAISEAIDNIIDCGGNLAEIFVRDSRTSGRFDIFIRDNGSGLNLEKIQKMFKIGCSDAGKGYETMGWKGVGIKAAAHASADRFWVVGREKDGSLVSAFMDFTINVQKWDDRQFSNVYHGPDVLKNTPQELLEFIPNEKNFVGCIQMFNNVKKSMVNKSPNVDSVVRKLLQPRTGTSRNNLSYIYREILNKKIKVTVNGQHLCPSGHGYENTPEGVPLSHRYFREHHHTGERVYNLTGPAGISWEITVFYTLSFIYNPKNGEIRKVTSTPNQGEMHLLRNQKEITTCKIPIPTYGNNYAIGQLHVDVHMPPEFIDKHSELASEKALKSLSAIGRDEYNFGKNLIDLIRRDLEECIAYNKTNFIVSDSSTPKENFHPEFIYTNRYYEFIKDNYETRGINPKEINDNVIKEDSIGIYGTRNDITDYGKIVEIKIQADHNSIGQCLNYMTQRNSRECRLVSITTPKNFDKFLKLKEETEKHYNVSIEFIDASDRKNHKFLCVCMREQLRPEEILAIKRFRNKKK